MGLCGSKIAARCVRFGNRDIPEWSSLPRDASLKDALDELYSETDAAFVKTGLVSGGGCVSLSSSDVVVSLNNITDGLCTLLSNLNNLRTGFGRVGRCKNNSNNNY